MEYIVENTETQKFLKVNGQFSSGIAFLKIFESEADAADYIEDHFPIAADLKVVKYEGFAP